MLGETAAAQGICDRTPQVRDHILNEIHQAPGADVPGPDCAEVTSVHLASVRHIWLPRVNLTALQEHDFSGLISLRSISLNGNLLTTLPEGVFQGLSKVESLFLNGNSLTTLPEGIFGDLGNLRLLILEHNSLAILPERIFHGLDNLEFLDMSNNFLNSLPEGVFQKLSKVESLDLSDNALTTLPKGIFRDMSSLKWLSFARNALTELPEGVFLGLNSLEILWLIRNYLEKLPPAVFNGLTAIEGLFLSRNSLSELPEDLFQGLDTLKSLTLYSNRLRSLPGGIFNGLTSIGHLQIHNNFLEELPPGIFDDLLDTLGGKFSLYPFSKSFTGNLRVSPHLQSTLAFTLPGQQASEGARVSVPVTLSRPSPVTVWVPYTVGIGRALGGLQDLSPSPNRGLLFSAGETRREITFTLPEEAGIQGKRSVVLTLGTSSEIGIRRSDGTGPDAPHLETESLVLRPGEGAVHTVTVTDFYPEEREPFCLSLWEETPCSSSAVLSNAIVGVIGESIARMELILTNRDPGARSCETAVLFHRGTGPAGAVSFDGRFPEGNLRRITVPKGGAEVLTLEAPEGEPSRGGAVHVFTRSPCTASSVQVQGRILIKNPGSGEIEELVSLTTQSPEDWLGDGDCRVLTRVFGNGRDVVLAAVTTEPDHPAPPGTTFDLHALDLTGKFLRQLPSPEITGAHQILSTGRWNRSVIIEACLNIPGTASPFRLAVTAIHSNTAGLSVQYGVENLTGGSSP